MSRVSPARSCVGKNRLATEQTARTAAAAAELASQKARGRKARRIVVDYYKCQFCGCFHLTHRR